MRRDLVVRGGSAARGLHVGFLTCELTSAHGWSRYAANLISALRAKGVQVTVLTSPGGPTGPDFSVSPVLPSAAHPAEAALLLKLALGAPHARRLLSDCEVVHSLIEPFAPLGAWIAGRRPFIVSGHGTYTALPVMLGWPLGWAYRRAFQRADSIVCVSRYTQRRLLDVVPDAESRVVSNGVHAHDLLRDLALVEPMPKRGPTLLAVGAVKPRKGTLELVRAVAKVRERVPDVQCAIVGTTDAQPAYAARVRDEIRTLGLGECVFLTGFADSPLALARWYKTADIFVLPSINHGPSFEGFGLVHLEAQLAGLPAIGTRDCGVEDAIDDGVTGLLVSQERLQDELPAALLSLLEDPVLCSKMGAAAHEMAIGQTWEQTATRMIEVYDEALGR